MLKHFTHINSLNSHNNYNSLLTAKQAKAQMSGSDSVAQSQVAEPGLEPEQSLGPVFPPTLQLLGRDNLGTVTLTHVSVHFSDFIANLQNRTTITINQF